MSRRSTPTDQDYADVCRTQFIPLVLYLCDQADIELPTESFNHAEIGPLIVNNLLAKGFTARFKTVKGETVK